MTGRLVTLATNLALFFCLCVSVRKILETERKREASRLTAGQTVKEDRQFYTRTGNALKCASQICAQIPFLNPPSSQNVMQTAGSAGKYTNRLKEITSRETEEQR